MNLVKLKTVDYPESDGQPMGETDVHREAMFRIIELLKRHFKHQKVYVSGDLLLYYEQGNPKKFVVPDAFIAKGLEQHPRRIYRMWVEAVVPQVVIETTSRSISAKDTHEKPAIYAKLGVHEYFMHDPTGEYLEPPLQGYRLQNGEYAPIEADSQGGLFSKELGLVLRITDDDLNLFDPSTNERLLTHAETAVVEAEARQREAEARQRAEAEIERLKAQLHQIQRPEEH
jgi:Uma2 family endonuclease